MKTETPRVRNVVDTTRFWVHMVASRGRYRMARGWHYAKLSLSNAPRLSFSGLCILLFLFLSLCRFCVFVFFFCSHWSLVDVPLIFFCPADHVPDWQPRIVLGMVGARSVNNVKKTTNNNNIIPLLLLFLTFSALVANPKKTTLHGGQSRSWSAEQRKKKKKKVWQRTPPPPRARARCSFGRRKNK